MFSSLQNKKYRVGVLRGGPSSEYEVSLKTGANIIKHLSTLDQYVAKDIFVDKQGVWHIDGLARSPERALRGIDVVFNAMHGQFGEDGRVQQILELHNVPYTGSHSLSSAIAMNKILSKQFYINHNVPVARHLSIKNDDPDRNAFISKVRENPHLRVVKPVAAGSSIGVTIIKDPSELHAAIEKAFEHSDTVMVEEFLEGREATCAVVESADGKHVYPLPPVEIIPNASQDFFDYDAKYNDLSQEICPGNFTKEEMYQIQELAARAHRALGLRHYSRTDMMVTPKGIFVLETNTLPGLTDASLLPKSLKAANCTLPEFVDHLLVMALKR